MKRFFINTERYEKQWCDGVAKILHQRGGAENLFSLVIRSRDMCVCVCVLISMACIIVKLCRYCNLHFVLWSSWVVPSTKCSFVVVKVSIQTTYDKIYFHCFVLDKGIDLRTSILRNVAVITFRLALVIEFILMLFIDFVGIFYCDFPIPSRYQFQ